MLASPSENEKVLKRKKDSPWLRHTLHGAAVLSVNEVHTLQNPLPALLLTQFYKRLRQFTHFLGVGAGGIRVHHSCQTS